MNGAGEFRFTDIRRFEELDSTNRWLLDEARAGAPDDVVAVADHQTAGRGRLGRTWEAPPGTALLCSVLLRPDLPPERLYLVTAAAALAGIDAVEAAAGWRPEIKWPNDLVDEDVKLAGILAEADLPAVVVGIGINLTWAPPGATCVSRRGGEVDREVVLLSYLYSLQQYLDDLDVVMRDYRAESATMGRIVRVELAHETIEGQVSGLTPDGHLVVEDRIITAGDVVHLRPTDRGPDAPAR